MSGRIGENHSETLAELVVEGLHRTGRDRFDRDRLQVMAIGGDTISESELVDGVMIDKERVNFNLPDSVSDATVALVNGALEAEFEDDEHQLRVERADDVSAFEQRKREIAAEQIAPYVDAGVDALFVSTFLDDYHQVHLVRDGTFAVRQMDLEDIHKIAAATGATVRDPLEPLRTDDLGYASHIAEIGFGDERRIRVESEGQDESVTLLLRGGTDHSLMELERTVEDAVSVVCTVSADGRIVPGAGACELSLASELRSYARSVDDRSQLAIEQFAEALETIPKTLARNAGVDVTDTLIDLRNEHERGNDSVGVAADGTTFDACEAGLIEPARLKDGVINGATEVTTQLLRADGVIATEPLSDDESDEILERVEQGEDPEEAVDNVRN